ncbi:MAG: hypothetical protein YPKNTGVA_001835 [Candidatus Fervidibacter sp.]|jgi:hypothetical protein
MPLTVNSIGQGSGNARPHHRANRRAQASLSGGQIAQATGLARVTGQAPHSGRPSPQGETGGLRLGAMGRRHKKQGARVAGAGADRIVKEVIRYVIFSHRQ